MGAPAKFLFDDDFAASRPRRQAARSRSPSTTPSSREAEADAYRNGLRGAPKRKAEAETRAAAALERIARRIDVLDTAARGDRSAARGRGRRGGGRGRAASSRPS